MVNTKLHMWENLGSDVSKLGVMSLLIKTSSYKDLPGMDKALENLEKTINSLQGARDVLESEIRREQDKK